MAWRRLEVVEERSARLAALGQVLSDPIRVRMLGMMAEGPSRNLAGDRFDALNAGTEATSVGPEALKAMAEPGVDISGEESNTLERSLGEPSDHVVTVCDDANEACPFFPGVRNHLHW